MQVLVGSGTILGGLISVLLLVLYGATIWRAIVLVLVAVLATLLSIVVIGFAVILTTKLNRRIKQHCEHARRRRNEAARLHGNEAERLWEQRRDYLQAIANGEIEPITDSDELLLRNSEMLWHTCLATTLRKNDTAYGTLCVTSMRVVFVSEELPLEIATANINAVNWMDSELVVVGKSAANTQKFFVNDPEATSAFISRTVRVYHRQVDVGFEARGNRHIPQDVKTAVWQRDGGKCVQCGATDYLEYDHIIPRAKGGANTVDNVQLLCRRCNLKKGAAI